MGNPELEHDETQALKSEKEVTVEVEEAREQAELLSPDQFAELQRRFEAAEAEKGELPVIEVEFETLNPETKEKIEQLEGEFSEAVAEADVSAAQSKLDLLVSYASRFADTAKAGGSAVLEFFDLDSKEKVVAAMAELVAGVGAAYALIGRRWEPRADKGIFELEKYFSKEAFPNLSEEERVAYVLGELVGSGHALRGAWNAISNQGLKGAGKHLAKTAAVEGGKLLVRRAVDKMDTQSTSDSDKAEGNQEKETNEAAQA